MYIFDLADSLILIMKASRACRIAGSIGAGVIGSMILVMFFTALMPVVSLSRLMPWVIGFNCALTGYMLLDKTRNSLKHKRAAAFCSGGLVVMLVCGIIFLIVPSIPGFFSVTVTHLAWWLLVGVIFSGLGGILAIKYLNLNEQEKE